MLTQIKVGDVTIHRIVEDVAPFVDFLTFFPDLPKEALAEHTSWLAPKCYDPASGKIVLTFQSYLIVTKHHRILVDTCVGNHKERPTRPTWHKKTSDRYEKNLAAVGYSTADIDFVCCTHLHGDHVGWNTRLDNGRWVPTFENARYLFADRELDYWTERAKTQPETCPWIVDSVLPIVAARRNDIVTSSHQMTELIRFFPTPGHTIDHFSVRVGQGSRDAIITGDMIHSPLQARLPDLGMMSDYDRAMGGHTRRKLFEEIADTATLLCAAHFPEPCIGHLKRWNSAYDFVPLG
ncbi:MAG TPA: MBL fold metallo-hydrolase [Hyphomicrobiaceae bacterium]|nr:MBL fold metallo-hydrolase [Hyphomicrobiaceae bacterium]